jgi:hypothetical protein
MSELSEQAPVMDLIVMSESKKAGEQLSGFRLK